MGILDDAIKEHLELKRAHGAAEEEIRRKEAEAFGPVRQEVVAEAPAAAPETEVVPAAAEPIEPDPLAVADDETALVEPADIEPPPPVERYETPSSEAETVVPQTPEAETVVPPAAPIEPAQPAAEDPYAVHPGDHAVPDPHHEGEPGGKDPAWREDTDFFADQPAYPEEQHDPVAEHAAEAGAGDLAESHVDPGPPYHPEERHPALHDTDEHFQPGHQPPEPVFRDQPPEPASAPEAPVAPQPESSDSEEEDVLEETPEFLQDAPEHDRLWFEQKPPRDFDFGE